MIKISNCQYLFFPGRKRVTKLLCLGNNGVQLSGQTVHRQIRTKHFACGKVNDILFFQVGGTKKTGGEAVGLATIP